MYKKFLKPCFSKSRQIYIVFVGKQRCHPYIKKKKSFHARWQLQIKYTFQNAQNFSQESLNTPSVTTFYSSPIAPFLIFFFLSNFSGQLW